MAEILHIQRYKASAQGVGGHHRLYQIYEDLQKVFGSNQVADLRLSKRKRTGSQPANLIKEFKKRIGFLGEVLANKSNPEGLLKILFIKDHALENPFGQLDLEPYFTYIKENGKPKVCILDHPSFEELARYNNDNKIANIYCPHNFESLVEVVMNLADRTALAESIIKFKAELEMLNLSQERFMISSVETNFVKGLGLSAHHYPYLPVGEIRSHLMELRSARMVDHISPNLFVMVGSIFHKPTYENYHWFLNNLKNTGLPPGVKLFVAGSGGDQLQDQFGAVPRVEIKDKITNAELDKKLIHATATLIPICGGFGMVTRVPDMACAGVPTVVSEHADAYGEIPPGIVVVKNDWDAWEQAMKDAVEHPNMSSIEEYEAWEARQPNPLLEVISPYL